MMPQAEQHGICRGGTYYPPGGAATPAAWPSGTINGVDEFSLLPFITGTEPPPGTWVPIGAGDVNDSILNYAPGTLMNPVSDETWSPGLSIGILASSPSSQPPSWGGHVRQKLRHQFPEDHVEQLNKQQ